MSLRSQWFIRQTMSQVPRATAGMEMEKLRVFLWFWAVFRYTKLFCIISKYSLGRLFKKKLFLYGPLIVALLKIEIWTLLP